LRGLGPTRRDRGLGQEAGGHLIGEVTEAVVDLDLDPSEAGGVPVQAVEQRLLHVIDLSAQGGCDVGQRGDDGAGLGLVADLHVRLAGAGEQTDRRLCYRDPEPTATFWESALAKVEWHAGELFPRVGFVVTDLRRSPKRVIKFYNGRGTAEQWIKEGKNALKWTRLSCRRFKDNQARLQLFALAYNLANFLRQLVLPRSVQTWTLTTLRGKLIKIGAKVVRHAKAVTFQLAEVAVPRELFAAILGRIGRLRATPSPG
jgi:hypothetical protein